MSSNYIYKKNKRQIKKSKIIGLLLLITGLFGIFYFTLPIMTSYALISNLNSSNNLKTPIPQVAVLNPDRIKNILSANLNNLNNVDYTDAKNWFPSSQIHPANYTFDEYHLSIPKIGIKDAVVSTKDYNVAIHLINYGGTAVPPDRGNAVVFGHSSLPQTFSMKDYKTIFAKLHMLDAGDIIEVRVENKTYTYKIESLSIVSPEDFSPLMQIYDKSYLTLITCTPPGTTWERLIVKSVLI